MFRRNPNRGYVAGVVRFEQPDNETSHRAILCDHAVRNRLRRGEKIFKRLTAVGFAVHKAPLISSQHSSIWATLSGRRSYLASTGGTSAMLAWVGSIGDCRLFGHHFGRNFLRTAMTLYAI